MPDSIDVYCCEPSWEGPALEELGRVFPGAVLHQAGPGWLECRRSGDLGGRRTPAMALCRQCLPHAEPIAADSISSWADAVTPRIIEALAGHDGPWRLHVFANEYQPASEISVKRCQRIKAAIAERLKKKQRRLLRTLDAASPLGLLQLGAENAPFLVQIALLAPGHGHLSLLNGPATHDWRRTVSLFSGGQMEIPPDRRPPSRAFAKLLEAERRLGRPIEAGQTCVDLGSSPGSWAYVALHRGARVIAVDRSELRADLMSSGAVTFVSGDAARFEPPQPVDWLLCDVVAPPEWSIVLLRRWLDRRWANNFVVTIKFQGREDYDKLEPLKSWLDEHTADFIVRRLTNNKNEVTAIGIVKA